MAYFNLQMFAADGHLNFDTKLDESGFTGGIKKLGSIAKSGMAVLGGAVAGVTSAMGAGVIAGMKYNADMQNYFSNFETMLGSAQAATEHVSQLKDFAAATPFEMADLANASKTLLAFGTDVNDVMPVMKMLGDVSLGNKDKFNSLALVFGQVSSQGKLMGQDLLQMINAGFNPLQVISEHTGESMASLKDRMSAGEIGIEEVTQAFQWATEEGGKFAGGMEKASKTFDGLVSTLKDNAMSLLGEVVQPLTEEMTKSLLPAALDAIGQLSEAFRSGGTGGLVKAGAGLLANVLLGISQKLPAVLDTAIGFINTLVGAINENLPQFMEAGGQILMSLLEGVLSLIPTLAEFGFNIVMLLADSIIGAASNINGSGIEIINGFCAGITEGLGALLEKGTEVIVSLAGAISAALPQLLPIAVQAILSFAQNIVNNLPKLLDAGLKMLQSLAQGIANSLPTVIALVPRLINSFADTIYKALPQILAAGVKLIITLGKGIIDSIPTIIANAGEIIKAIINVISLTNLFSLGKSLISGLIKGIKSMGASLSSAGGELMKTVVNKIKTTDWISVGKNMISGMVNGVKNNAKKLVEAAAAAVTDALNWVKQKLGIHSPSRVFQDEVGKNIALGIAEGISKNKEFAQKSAEEIAQATLDAAKKKLDNHKVYNNLTLADEVAYWNAVRKQTKDGTQARIDADKEYFSAKKNLDSQMLQLDEEYTANVAKAYSDLNDKIQNLNKQYKDAVDQRADAIKSAFGLFDEFNGTSDLTSDDLLNNLQSQVDGLRQWENNLDNLSSRGIGKDMLKELQDLGPKAAGEIQLMTEMSDEQLSEYVSLFKDKNRLARKQAVEEMKPMREDIAAQIVQMKQETAFELSQYQRQYTESMKQLGVSINQPLETMKLTAAQNAVELVASMADSVKSASSLGENVDKFRAIAENVLGAVKTLPASMSVLGKNVIESMIEGIQSMSGKLYEAVYQVVGTAVNSAVDSALSSQAVNEMLGSVGQVTGSGLGLTASVYGNEGYGPGHEINYKRMGQEMGAAMERTGVYMDGKSVGSIVAETINNVLGGRTGDEGRGLG